MRSSAVPKKQNKTQTKHTKNSPQTPTPSNNRQLTSSKQTNKPLKQTKTIKHPPPNKAPTHQQSPQPARVTVIGNPSSKIHMGYTGQAARGSNKNHLQQSQQKYSPGCSLCNREIHTGLILPFYRLQKRAKGEFFPTYKMKVSIAMNERQDFKPAFNSFLEMLNNVDLSPASCCLRSAQSISSLVC